LRSPQGKESAQEPLGVQFFLNRGAPLSSKCVLTRRCWTAKRAVELRKGRRGQSRSKLKDRGERKKLEKFGKSLSSSLEKFKTHLGCGDRLLGTRAKE